MPYASTPTLLSLRDFAKVLGLDPLHFSQAVSALRPSPTCPRIWFQYDWQDPDIVSREQIGYLIDEAERDLADALGFWPAPKYIVDEFHRYPRPHQPEMFGTGANVRLRWKSMRLSRGWVIEGGQRTTTVLNSGNGVAFTLVDADGDTFTETAQFSVTVPTGTDACDIHAYFKEYAAADAANSRTDLASSGPDPSWEVRPLRTSVVGTTATIYTEVWNLIRPQLQEELAPDEGGIDGDDFGTGPGTANLGSYVDELLFYVETTDPATQVQFLWAADLGCTTAACADDTQVGCFSVKDRKNSLVIPRPSTYNAVNQTFTVAAWSNGLEADGVRFWYRAGWTPENQRGCSELDPYWAKVIAMLAVSRMDWPLCDCTNVKELTDYWRQDAAKMTPEKSFNLRPDELSNPFGQRVGEVLAWRRCANRLRKRGQTVNV